MDYPFGSDEGAKKKTLEGFPITIAKRVQSAGEDGRASRVILADRAYRDYVALSHREHEFSYLGRKQFKGISQSISCYEWLGMEFEEPLILFSDENRDMLNKLSTKNPVNPWYAMLLAHFFYQEAEKQWFKFSEELGDKEKFRTEFEERVKKLYTQTLNVCTSAVQNISWTNLRSLNTLLLTSLEVIEEWEELSYRGEQAFNNDPAFANALALKAKALLELGGDAIKKAKEESKRVINIFRRSEENEALFYAKLIHATTNLLLKADEMIEEDLSDALSLAEKGRLKWASREFEEFQKKWFSNTKDRRIKKYADHLVDIINKQKEIEKQW
jgi:hypothetical protein